MFLHVGDVCFNLIPGSMDRFSHLLWGGSSIYLNGTVPLQVTQIFVRLPKKIGNRLLLREHTIKTEF